MKSRSNQGNRTWLLVMTMFLITSFMFGYSQDSSLNQNSLMSMEFQNQDLVDILFVFSQLLNISIIPDETVQGKTSFYFIEEDPQAALERFLSLTHLYATSRNGGILVSKIHLEKVSESSDQDLYDFSVEGVDITTVFKVLSRQLSITILPENLPRVQANIHLKRSSLEVILSTLVSTIPEFELLKEENYWVIRRRGVQPDSPTSTSVSTPAFELRTTDSGSAMYSLNTDRSRFLQLIEELMIHSGNEYVIMLRSDVTIERVNVKDLPLDEMLTLLCNMAGADFTVISDVYYIFELQRKDALRNLKTTASYSTIYLGVQEINSMIPSDLLGGITIRVDKTSNRLWLTGSPEEVRSVIEFLQTIDVPPSDGVTLQTFYVNHIGAREALTLFPQGFLPQQATVFPNNTGFALFASQETALRISEFIRTIDSPGSSIPVSLQYIRAEDLIKNLPPSIPKEKVVPSGSDDLVFFTGTPHQFELFKRDLAVLDRPFAQIKYRILVIQYQRSGGEKAEVSFKAGPSENTTTPFDFGVAGEFGKLLGLRFDVISGFGYDFALGLDFQLRSDQARVVADTMVTGLAGQELKFQNTNTYRYFTPSTDPDTGEEKDTGITREITSGLIIGLKGWVSGNGMITMDINATVSKRGTSAEDNLSTSERVVSTQARTQAGIPLVVGGLLQWDTVTKETKVPFLGDIPLLGALFRSREKVDELTELVIYILPTVVTTKQVATVEDQLGYWYEKFANRLSTSLQNHKDGADEE